MLYIIFFLFFFTTILLAWNFFFFFCLCLPYIYYVFLCDIKFIFVLFLVLFIIFFLFFLLSYYLLGTFFSLSSMLFFFLHHTKFLVMTILTPDVRSLVFISSLSLQATVSLCCCSLYICRRRIFFSYSVTRISSWIFLLVMFFLVFFLYLFLAKQQSFRIIVLSILNVSSWSFSYLLQHIRILQMFLLFVFFLVSTTSSFPSSLLLPVFLHLSVPSSFQLSMSLYMK